MEIILFAVLTVVFVWVAGKARAFGEKHIWGKVTEKINNETLRRCEEALKKEEERKKKAK